jgi:hypothetical protein
MRNVLCNPFFTLTNFNHRSRQPNPDNEEIPMSHQNWSDRDERQYQHFMNKAKASGKNPDRAREIAARKVNKIRYQEPRLFKRSISETVTRDFFSDERNY